MRSIRDRFPHRSEIFSVFGTAVFLCFSWTILGFLSKLSSFLLRFTTAEIAEIFIVMMAFALLESLALTGSVIALSVILPARWLREGFALKGSVLIVVSALASITYQNLLSDHFPAVIWLVLGLVGPVVLIVFMIFFIQAHPKLQSVLLDIQDRISILLFIYVPLGLISLVLFLYRNIF